MSVYLQKLTFLTIQFYSFRSNYVIFIHEIIILCKYTLLFKNQQKIMEQSKRTSEEEEEEEGRE